MCSYFFLLVFGYFGCMWIVGIRLLFDDLGCFDGLLLLECYIWYLCSGCCWFVIML